MNKSLLTAALLGIMSILPATAMATKMEVSEVPSDSEKCYGVAAKGKNDCKSPSKAHECKGQAKVDNDSSDWIYLKKGECLKVAGGEKTPS